MGIRIMIKYGKKDHLQQIVDGNLRFAPSQQYVEMERDLHNKGQGDLLDGKMKIKFERAEARNLVTDELMYVLPQSEVVVSTQDVNNMPIFCLSYYGDDAIKHIDGREYIVLKPYVLDSIKKDFKDATHALVIFEPEKFIEDVHGIGGHQFIGDSIRYYDYNVNSIQMFMFLCTGCETLQKNVELSMTYENRYRNLLCKDISFSQQQEYRFIGLDELITSPVFYKFEFNSNYAIVPIDQLYTPVSFP